LDIKKLRIMCGMTQAEFSKALGMSVSTLRSWEQGNKNHRQCKKWVYDLIVYFLNKEGYLK
jgi:DNA-binding transcriptional regulator YiaG